MTRPLIIVGASARAAAWSARDAGFEPYSIDLFADKDTRAAGRAVRIERYPGDFLAALRQAPDGPWMYVGGLENFPRLVERMAAVRPLLGSGGEALRAVRSPKRLERMLQSHGFGYPAASVATSDGRCLVKPLRSGGGQGVRWATDEERGRRPRGHHLQAYIEGLALSAVYLGASDRRAELVGISRQLIGRDFRLEAPFAYAGSVGPFAVAETVERELRRLGNVLASEGGLIGLFGVDLVLDEERLWAIEVNPRLTASVEVLERATQANLVAAHVAACRGGGSDLLGGATRAIRAARGERLHGKAIVYARGKVSAGERFASLVAAWTHGNERWIADIPNDGTVFSPGEPVATVFASASTTDEVVQQLRNAADEVHASLDA